jgi:hypothetical protein
MMRKIPWAPGYFVTPNGDVFSAPKRTRSGLRKLKPGAHPGGYWRFKLVVAGGARSVFAHRLVAEAYLPNPKKRLIVRHLDGDPRNNAVSNLAWSTQRENIHDKWRHGTMATGDRNGRRTHPELIMRGSQSPSAKLNERQVRALRSRSAAGETYAALGREFGVAKSTVFAAVRGPNWRHLEPGRREGAGRA